ncbi:endonuclease MutS2 [candidate division KSB1 bacterium]|nr:endonuclease MutS2 [candidate division KSB1 bacterium]
MQILEFDRIRERLTQCAASPLGAQLAVEIAPINDLAQLRRNMQQTTEMRDLLDYDQSVPMDGIHDLRPLYARIRIAGGFLSPEELVAVQQTLTAARLLKDYLYSRKQKIPALMLTAESLQPLEAVEKEIRHCIDDKNFSVKDHASAELAALRKGIARAQNQARSRMETMVRALGGQGLLQENIITVRDGRLVLIVKEEYKRQVRGLVHDQSASGSSLFIEPLEAVEDNNRIRELLVQEDREIQRILIKLTDSVRTSLSILELNIDILAQLDLIYARAVFSRLLSAYPPELPQERIIEIAGGRHPLLLLRMGEKQVVPLDLNFGESFRTLIISGPNAGGKTVALKTIGLLTLMARCGLHIPAQPHSKIGAIDKIFASIGDQQSIDNDLSTFSSHLDSLKQIAAKSDADSLVLIDEIGAGTDPEEGSALAMALLETLTAKGCLSVVTTHQSALKAFAFRTEGVANGSMEFDVKTLNPTYHFRIGIPGSSYAFEIAHRMGLPKRLIERARKLVGSQKDRLEGLILELEEKIQRYQQVFRDASIKESEYRGLMKLYQERYDALKREEKQIKRRAADEAEEMLQQANAAVENAIREIREKNAQRQVIREAKEALAKQRQRVAQEKEATAEEKVERVGDEAIVAGDFVSWEKFHGSGQVLSKVDGQGRVLLQMGGVKIKAPVAELIKTTHQPPQQKGGVRIDVDSASDYKNEIDLRGQRAEEALQQVERFLDEALLAGFSEVRIIHGKGTGRLRNSITQYLRRHPRVIDSRLGNWNEGEAGVTVVALQKT